MKKILAIFAAMTLVLSMAACGNDDAGKSVTQGSAVVDDKGNEIKGTAIDGAGKEVDMDKLDGVELEEDDNAENNDEGIIAKHEVSIEDAKVIENDGSKILVVTFEYKNNSSGGLAFDNIISVDVSQNDAAVMPTVVTNVDGINILSGVEVIDPGKETTVQKTYLLTDEESPVTVLAYKFGEPTNGSVIKTFNLK